MWQTFPFQRAWDLIPELVLAGVRAVTVTGGGEPLMHPQSALLMERLTTHGMPWGLVTNGYLLRGSAADAVSKGATFVRISLDAGSEAMHWKMHRPKTAQYHAILDNLAGVVALAATCGRARPLMVGASFCVTDENYHEIGQAAQQVKDRGGAYLEVRPTYPTDWRGDGLGMALTNVSAAIDALEDARRALDGDGFQIVGMIDRFDALAHPNHDYPTCQIGPLTTVLGADGRLWWCCVQRGQDGFALGSVLDKPFTEAWRIAQELHLERVINVKNCPRCRYQNYNRILNGVAEDKMHVNFV